MKAMAAESNEEERSTRRRPWTMNVEVKGAGGLLVLGGAIIAGAFAAHRARVARRRRAAAAAADASGSTSSNATPQAQKGQEEECSGALPGSGGVADGVQRGDGSGLCGAALEDERKEQISLKAEDDATKSKDVFELEKTDLVIHEDRTLRELDCCFVSNGQQAGEIKSENSEQLLDASKFSHVVEHVKEDSSSESSLNKPCNQMQVMSDGLMMAPQKSEQATSATASRFSIPQYHPEVRIEETKAVHVTEIEEESEEGSPVTEPFEQVEESDEEEVEVRDEGSEILGVYSSYSPSSESSAEPIWPAEVIEQEKSVVSAELMNDSSSHEEVKDMVHSEDSSGGRTDAILEKEAESEEMKLKPNAAAAAAAVDSSGTFVVLKKNSKGLLPRVLQMLLLFAVATALGLVSLLDKEQLITGHLTELCNKFFHTIFASSDNRYEL